MSFNKAIVKTDSLMLRLPYGDIISYPIFVVSQCDPG